VSQSQTNTETNDHDRRLIEQDRMQSETEEIAQLVSEDDEISEAMTRHERVAHFAFLVPSDSSSEQPMVLKDVTQAFKAELGGKGLNALRQALEQSLSLDDVARVYLGLTFRTKDGLKLRVDGYGEALHSASNFVFSHDRSVRQASSECHFDSEQLFQNAVLNGNLSSKIFEWPKVETH